MGPKTKAVFDILRRKANDSGYGSWIKDEDLQATATEIVNKLNDLYKTEAAK